MRLIDRLIDSTTSVYKGRI